MIKLSDIKKNDNLPSFIRNHNIFNSNIELKKIFPEIGLNNFSEKINIDNSSEVVLAAGGVVSFLRNETTRRIYSLTRYAEVKCEPGTNRQVKYKKCNAVLKKFNSILSKPIKTLIILNEKTGKITLNISENIQDENKKILFKRGEGLFKVYQKINEILRNGHFLAMTPLEKSDNFKKYNSVNIAASEAKIVFSSEGMEGAWDIATMSMRGISSCQSWHQGNAVHLIGSIIDPCTAIMYLTSGSDFDGKGFKMMRRCIVRFVIESNNPKLILEKMYPTHNKDVALKFASLLKSKVNNKIAIIDNTQNLKTRWNLYSPLTPIVSKLKDTFYPYIDSGITFRVFPERAPSDIIIRAKFDSFAITYANKTKTALRAVKLSELTTSEDKASWKKLRPENPGIIICEEMRASINRAASVESRIKNNEGLNKNILRVHEAVFSPNNIKNTIECAILNSNKRFSEFGRLSRYYHSFLTEKIKLSFAKQIEKDRKLLVKLVSADENKKLNSSNDSLCKLIQKVS